MYHFCTICTVNYLYKTYALFDSIAALGYDFRFHVLCIDAKLTYNEYDERFITYQLFDLQTQTALDIKSKYDKHSEPLRRSLKPVFLSHLLVNENVESAIYVDNDIAFFNDYRFLFDLLDSYSFLLTPNYYQSNPKKDQNWLEANFRVGLYNSGFVGVSRKALKSLNWWEKCCVYRCEKNTMRGLFDEQKYLDLIPVIEESAHIVRHMGCNLGDWNRQVCNRILVGDKVLVNGKYAVIFIHFNSSTIREIIDGCEPLLQNYFNLYSELIRKHSPSTLVKDMYVPVSFVDKLKLDIWSRITTMGF